MPQTGPRSNYIQAAGHELHVTEWGVPGRPAVVMWHGLARNGRDFDELAEALSDECFVLCPDTPGRGLSAWSKDPERDYSYHAYADLAVAMLDHYGVTSLRWVGTSMGGLLGIVLIGGRLRDRTSHLVINDVGPEVNREGIARLASYVGTPPVFDTISEIETWFRGNYVHFGQNSDEFWRRLRDTSVRRTDDGRITVHYDPKIAQQLSRGGDGIDFWQYYDAITAKTLLVRGDRSDLFPAETAAKMQARGPRPGLHIVPDCGHAPTLASARDRALIRDFLLS